MSKRVCSVAHTWELHEDLQRIQIKRDDARAIALEGEQGHVIHQPCTVHVLRVVQNVLRLRHANTRLLPLLPQPCLFEPLFQLAYRGEILIKPRSILCAKST